MKKKCPVCHHEYENTHRYCPYCGSPNNSYQTSNEMIRIHPALSLRLFLIGFFIFNLIGFIISFVFSAYALSVFGNNKAAIDQFLSNIRIDMFVNTISYSVIFVFLLFASRFSIPQFLKSFLKKNSYVAGLVGVAAIYVFSILYSLLLGALNIKVGDNINEQSLDSAIKLYPVISLIVFGLIGPICEELTYRVGIFSFLYRRSKVLAYILTIVLFSFIHFTLTSTDALLNELLNLPYYAFTAFVLCYLYEHYGFSASVFTHVLNNTISVITELIV